MPNFFYSFTFYLFCLIALASAITFVTRRSPVAAAIWLVQTMFALAVLYIMLDAQFIGAIQVLVYAGAIMVVFLFVVMLLNLGHASDVTDIRGKWGKLAAAFLGLVLLAQLAAVLQSKAPPSLEVAPGAMARDIERLGAVGAVAQTLFTEYLLPFEVTSVLLLVAIIGAVVLGRRRAA